MGQGVSGGALDALFREVDLAIAPLVDSIDVGEIGAHNRGYLAYGTDKFRNFVAVEKARYRKAVEIVTSRRTSGTVCDLGCFIPYLPIALARLGYKVGIVDKYALYGDRMRARIAETAAGHGIEVFDLDIVNDDMAPLGKNDVVLLMAVVEHLSGTPRMLMEKVRGIMAADGLLVFEVPNLAEMGKRLKLLLGRSPLPDYADYYHSHYPFTGHNREMTVAEVEYLLKAGGFAVESLSCYDCYDLSCYRTIRGKLVKVLKKALPLANKGESIMAVARPAG
ncbi:MAG: methyltransferase domain-containing protein [Deltaproteobacteria bacterium]|nr:methyltransferase domain-containing protein [Deltaproteobacteria bacterium]